MKLKQLFTEDRAVSPVIGVILMVAITVILAAVIGTFVLGLGDQVSQSQPNANVGFDYYDTLTAGSVDNVNLTHKGGDKLNANDLKVTIGGATAFENGAIASGSEFAINQSQNAWNDDSITAGDQLWIDDSATTPGTGIENGDKVRVIWSADNGDTAIIAEGTVQ